MTSFWSWFFRGTGAGPGVRRYFDWWLVLHVFVGLLLSIVLPIPLETAGVSLLLPLAGVLVGLSFAWGGNVQALLQSQEIENLVGYRAGGYEEYIFTFQAAILLILCTLVAWGAAGIGIFDRVWPVCQDSYEYHAIVGLLFFLASLSLRDCWHIIIGSQALLLMRFKIKQQEKDKST